MTDHQSPTTGSGCLDVGDRPGETAVAPCRDCRKRPGATFLEFQLVGSDSLLVVNIKASPAKQGWGRAMVRFLQEKYPERCDWRVESINEEAEVFWKRMSDRHGVQLKLTSGEPALS